jgi:hypothetical protein
VERGRERRKEEVRHNRRRTECSRGFERLLPSPKCVSEKLEKRRVGGKEHLLSGCFLGEWRDNSGHAWSTIIWNSIYGMTRMMYVISDCVAYMGPELGRTVGWVEEGVLRV